MIIKNISNLPKSQVDVSITVPWSDLEPKWNETLTKLAQDVELPGFRKGIAPLNMVEQNLGQRLQDEVFKVAMPQFLIEALQGTNIVPIDYPQYQIVSFQKGANLQFSAKITARPTIQVGNYKSVKVARPALKQATDEEVGKVVEELFKRWKLRNPQSQVTAGNGEIGQNPKNRVQSGSMSFNAATSLTPQPPSPNAPDDTFAQGVGVQNLVELKLKIKTDLENEAKYNNELDFEEAILQEIEKITQVEIPDILVQDELNRMLISLQRNVTDRGLLLDEYLKSQNKTVDSIKNEWKIQAEKNVRMELGLSEIAKMEGINISDEELQAEIDKIQDQRVKAQFGADEPKIYLRHALRQTKTLNLLKSLIG